MTMHDEWYVIVVTIECRCDECSVLGDGVVFRGCGAKVAAERKLEASVAEVIVMGAGGRWMKLNFI